MVSTKGMLRRHIFFKQSTYLIIFDNEFKWVLCWRRRERSAGGSGAGSVCHWQQNGGNSLLSLREASVLFVAHRPPSPNAVLYDIWVRAQSYWWLGLQLEKHRAPMGRGSRQEWMRRRWSGGKSQSVCYQQNSNVGPQSETALNSRACLFGKESCPETQKHCDSTE